MERITRGPRARNVAVVALGLVLALGAWLRWTSPEQVADLRPRGDALEYEETARSLARGDGYVLIVAGEAFPPTHPFGFPALLAPYLWLADEGFGSGIRVVLACALITITATWLLGAAAGGAASAVLAALLLATNALHVTWSRAVMSDVPATAVTSLLAWWTLRLLDGPPARWGLLLLGIASGLGASIRAPAILLLVPTVSLLAICGWPRRARVVGLLALGLGTVLGLLPTLAYNTVRFGSPLLDGVSFWVAGSHFGSVLVLPSRDAGGQPNHVYYPRLLGGLGSLYPWPIAVLIAGGAALALRRPGPPRRLAILALGFTAAVFAFHVRLVWQWSRYFLLPLPLLLAMGSLTVGRQAPRWLRAAGAALATVGIAIVLQQPHVYAPPDRPTREVAALKTIDAMVEPDAIIVGHTTTILFERLLRQRTDRVLVPIGVDEFQLPIILRRLQPLRSTGASREWLRAQLPRPANAAAVVQRIDALLAEGRPVYYTPMLGMPGPETTGMLPLLMTRFRLRLVGVAGPAPLYRMERR